MSFMRNNMGDWMKERESIVRIVRFVLILVFVAVGLTEPCRGAEEVNRPVIELAKIIYEFGQVSEGEVVTHDFKVFNRGDAVLEIKQVKPG